MNKETEDPGRDPQHGRLGPDARSWWTGEEWVEPLYERTGLSALVTVMSRFMGTLRVFRGAVVFTPSADGWSRVANAVLNVESPPAGVVHRDRRVAIVFGRLGMPWLNSGIVLVDPETLNRGTAVVQAPGWERRRLVRALSAGGFTVDLHPTAFSMGSEIGSQAELDRLRGR